jgi:hypothetical protein
MDGPADITFPTMLQFGIFGQREQPHSFISINPMERQKSGKYKIKHSAYEKALGVWIQPTSATSWTSTQVEPWKKRIRTTLCRNKREDAEGKRQFFAC